MKITICDGYKRLGKKVAVTAKIELDEVGIDKYNEEYYEAYMFIWYIYNGASWEVETKIEHDIYKLKESSKAITNNQFIDVLLNSEVYTRIKKAMKIK